jgi:hypothetical protein
LRRHDLAGDFAADASSIMILVPKPLQITAERGNLNFSYRGEFQTLPEGQTLRIYLDPPSGPDRTAVAGAQKAQSARSRTLSSARELLL